MTARVRRATVALSPEEHVALLEATAQDAGVAAYDWEVGGDVYWSEEMFRLLGREPTDAEVEPEEFLAAIHPDDRTRIADAHAAYLTVIGASLEVLERDAMFGAAPPLMNVRYGLERCASLTGQLLAFARRKPAQPRRVDLRAVIEAAAQTLDRALGEQGRRARGRDRAPRAGHARGADERLRRRRAHHPAAPPRDREAVLGKRAPAGDRAAPRGALSATLTRGSSSR